MAVAKSQNPQKKKTKAPKSNLAKFKDKISTSMRNITKARKGTWTASSKAPMMLKPEGKPVTRAKPGKPGETYTTRIAPKFRFIDEPAFLVAGAGAMTQTYKELKTRGRAYRTFVPDEAKTTPIFGSLTPGAKQMLSYFLQSYAAEAATYAAKVREETTSLRSDVKGGPKTRQPTSGRINQTSMQIGMEIADSKIFGSANLAKKQFHASLTKAELKAIENGLKRKKEKAAKRKADAASKPKSEKKAKKQKVSAPADGAPADGAPKAPKKAASGPKDGKIAKKPKAAKDGKEKKKVAAPAPAPAEK